MLNKDQRLHALGRAKVGHWPLARIVRELGLVDGTARNAIKRNAKGSPCLWEIDEWLIKNGFASPVTNTPTTHQPSVTAKEEFLIGVLVERLENMAKMLRVHGRSTRDKMRMLIDDLVGFHQQVVTLRDGADETDEIKNGQR